MVRYFLSLLIALLGVQSSHAQEKRLPNILFILADDLGYGDLGCYGQKKIKTPNIDQLAQRGMRFTQFYSGSTVCAPSRCSLLTGLHTGHCSIRGNGTIPMPTTDPSVSAILKMAGYATAVIGKWGMGESASAGSANKHGFDLFFGYANHVHAHNYYPDFLWRNGEKVPLPNEVKGGVASVRKVYSPDLFTQEALEFIEKNRSRPFFLYLALTIPHANNEAGQRGMEIPSDEPYSNENWPQPQKNHAAMITRMDRDLGRLFTRLQELGLEKDTIIFFTSDNGPHKEGGADPAFFQSSGGLRGFKRSLHEGGLRVPFIVCWPGRVPAGTTNPFIGAFWDFLPTASDLAGVKGPAKTDGISILPTLLGKDQKIHEHLYWEFHEGGFSQAVRLGNFRGIRKLGGATAIYDLVQDPAETTDIAPQHPKLVERIEAIMKMERTENTNWVPNAQKKKKG